MYMTSGIKKLAAGTLALTFSLLAVTACTPSKPAAAPSVKPAAPATSTPDSGQGPLIDLSSYYSQKFEWETDKQDDRFYATRIKVPLNYYDAKAGDAEIYLRAYFNENEDSPVLFMNPGGPGGSGADTLLEGGLEYFFSPALRAKYHVIGFDPRGVQHSTPSIKCRDAKELDEDNARWTDLSTEEGRAKALVNTKELGEKCLERSGAIARYADTESTARDLDILRAVMGQDQLNYLGFSYGTYLGAMYIRLFPAAVGRMVLDGVLDPGANINQVSEVQARGFEASVVEFSRRCQAFAATGGVCPLSGGPEAGAKQIGDFLVSLTEKPLPTKDGRPLTRSLATTGVVGSMYSTVNWESEVFAALNDAMRENDGTQLLTYADRYNSREPDGTYKDNGTDAFTVINSLDYVPVGTFEEWKAQAAKLEAELPAMGSMFGWASFGMDQWPVKGKNTNKEPLNISLGKPILLIGNTGDAATPYVWAKSVHSQIKDSKLLTVKSFSHTAYSSYAPACVRDTVDNYFATGKIADGVESLDCSA